MSNLSIKNHMKKIIIVLVAIFCVVGLSSCSNKSRTLGSIDPNEIFAQSGNYSVTNSEIWEQLKWQVDDFIQDDITNIVLKPYIEQAAEILKGDNFVQKELFYNHLEEQARNAIYEVTDKDELDNMQLDKKKTLEDKYIDSYYTNYNKKITREWLLEEKDVFKNTDTDVTFRFKYVNIFDKVMPELAKKLLGVEKLKEEITKYEKKNKDKTYYSNTNILDKYEEKYEHSNTVKSIIIKFTNDEEMNRTFKAFGVKVFKDRFYFIPQEKNETYSKYSKRYDDFDFDLIGNYDKFIDVEGVGGENIVFQLYLEFYNYVYAYRTQLYTMSDLSSNENKKDITTDLISKFKSGKGVSPQDHVKSNLWTKEMTDMISYEQDDLSRISTDLRKYIFTDLKVEPEGSEVRYSYSSRTIDSASYMAYKVDEEKLPDHLILVDKESGEIINEELKAKIIEELIWDDVDKSYSDTKLDIEVNNATVYIYDESVEIAYSVGKTKYSKTYKKAPERQTIFSVKYNKTTYHFNVDGENGLFNKLLNANGVTIAIDLLSKKAVYDSEEYKKIKEDKDQIKDFKYQFEVLLNRFTNDEYNSNGFPSSIGKYNFLMLYFKTSKIDEIIDSFYILNAASTEILSSYAASKDDDATFNLMKKFADVAYDNYFSLTASTLLAFVDFDDDGKVDLDFDWNTAVKTEDNLTYAQMTKMLMNDIIKKLNNSSEAHLTTLSSIVEEYNSTQKFTNGIDQPGGDGDFDPTQPETRWAKYKRAGIVLKVESLETVDSTSETTTGATGGLEIEVKNEIKKIYNSEEFDIFNTYQKEYTHMQPYLNGGDGFVSRAGYNLIIVSDAVERNSAKFEKEDDVNDLYVDIYIKYNDEFTVIENAYSDTDYISLNQVKLFVYEYLKTSNTSLATESVNLALTTYLKPVFEKYTSSGSQRELLLNRLLGGIDTLVFTDTTNKERLLDVMEINRRVDDNYLLNEDLSNNFVYWENGKYVTWWDLLTVGGIK
ncbi:MAG: hypothetical protein ACRC5M_05075 [Anaeroplasmataceae bacterium]